jgi:hypothetical protein
MATAVCGNVTRAASDEFSGFAKIKPVAGQSPLPERQPPKNAPASPITKHFSLCLLLAFRLAIDLELAP